MLWREPRSQCCVACHISASPPPQDVLHQLRVFHQVRLCARQLCRGLRGLLRLWVHRCVSNCRETGEVLPTSASVSATFSQNVHFLGPNWIDWAWQGIFLIRSSLFCLLKEVLNFLIKTFLFSVFWVHFPCLFQYCHFHITQSDAKKVEMISSCLIFVCVVI